jgi:Putative adhesin
MRFAVACGVLASSLAAASCVVSVDSQALIERDEKRFSVKGAPNLNLTTFDGAIEIRSWDQAAVLVEIEKRGATREAVDSLVVEVQQDGDRISVEVKRPKSETFNTFGFHSSASAKLIVSVPQRTDIVARSGDGSIRVERVIGKLELRTGDGSIRASDIDGQTTLTTGDGSVHVDGAQGRLEVDTGDGSVEVGGTLTAVKLHTGDGSIVYRADVRTVMSGDWEITTGDGSVTMYLPQDFSAELDARTSDGGIRNELHAAMPNAEAEDDSARGSERRDRDDSSRHALKARLGDGGKVLKIRTGDGSIRLRVS